MYGLVNQAIKDLVTEKFGDDKWQAICKSAGIEDDDFSALQSYPDEMTYNLVGAVSKELAMPAEAVLKAFGKYWTLFTSRKGYGELMDMFGGDLFSAIDNLNQLHDRMAITMPELRPPKFELRRISPNEAKLEYHSVREGLAPMLVGLLEGLAEKFNTKITIDHEPRNAQQKFDVFLLKKVA